VVGLYAPFRFLRRRSSGRGDEDERTVGGTTDTDDDEDADEGDA
jgi:hypothetical protein